MKTFLTQLQEYGDALNPQFNYGGSSVGPGLDQHVPVVDLNAQSEKEIKKSDLDQIEKYADRLFASLDIDVEFTRHFLDRVNDQRNVKQITSSELIRLFKQSFKKYGKTIAKLGPDAEAVINDMKTDINMPFVLNVKGGELELVAKTVMRKKNFKTPDKKLSFESFKEAFEFFPKKLYEKITLPNPPIDVDKEISVLKGIMENRTEEDEISIKNHDEHSFYAIEKYCEKHSLVFHDDEMKDIITSASETIGHFKEKFNVTRPFVVDKSIKPMGSKTNKTKSYPSGHACQSRLVGLYVASKFPEHEKGVMEAAKECGIGRVLAGFHYLSDYVSGNLLADKMFIVMNKDNYGRKK